jgi:hypothetical protein
MQGQRRFAEVAQPCDGMGFSSPKKTFKKNNSWLAKSETWCILMNVTTPCGVLSGSLEIEQRNMMRLFM